MHMCSHQPPAHAKTLLYSAMFCVQSTASLLYRPMLRFPESESLGACVGCVSPDATLATFLDTLGPLARRGRSNLIGISGWPDLTSLCSPPLHRTHLSNELCDSHYTRRVLVAPRHAANR